MRGKNKEMLIGKSRIKGRWKNYFEQLLNKENSRMVVGDGILSQTMRSEISKEEVKR